LQGFAQRSIEVSSSIEVSAEHRGLLDELPGHKGLELNVRVFHSVFVFGRHVLDELGQVDLYEALSY